MTARTLWVCVAVGAATATLWLALATQPSLPDYPRTREGWSGDFRSYYLPNAEYAGERLAAGELPLWNPHHALGGPFLATLQVGALYPPNWLHALLPAPRAFLLLACFHLALAGLTAGLLVSAYGAKPLGCAVGALVYAGSQQLLVSVYSPPLLYAAAWAPLLLYAVDRIVERVSAGRVALMAVSVAMLLLAGWPYTFAMAALGAALYGGALLAANAIRNRAVPWSALLALVTAAVAGAMLAAPQLLPTGELLDRSCRAVGSVVEGQAIFVDRPHDPGQFWRTFLRLGFNGGIPGVAALVLAGLALLLPGPGRFRIGALLAVGGFGLMASFPNDLPVYRGLRELPLLGDFRFPFRYRFLTSLALSVAAGVGTAHLLHCLRRWPWLATTAGVAALITCLSTATVPGFRRTLPFPRNVPPSPSLVAEFGELGATLETGERGRVYWANRASKRGADTSLDVLFDMEPMSLARTAELITFFETGRPRTLLSLPHELDSRALAGDSVAAPFYGHLGIPVDGKRAEVLDLLSVRWIVAPRGSAGWLDERYRRLSPPGSDPAVFENPHALPRAYRVPSALPAPKRLRAALVGMLGEGFDARRHVLLEAPPRVLLRAAQAGLDDPEAEVEIERYAEEEVVLRTKGARPGVVVLTDAHFPGWRATLDGRPVPLLRANLAFRGVAVPAGEHRIEMRYGSRPLRWGGMLALLAAVGLALPFARRARAGAQTMREVRSPQ